MAGWARPLAHWGMTPTPRRRLHRSAFIAVGTAAALVTACSAEKGAAATSGPGPCRRRRRLLPGSVRRFIRLRHSGRLVPQLDAVVGVGLVLTPGASSAATPTTPTASSSDAQPQGSGSIVPVPATLTVDTIATGLTMPWGLGFLPDGTALVTERDTGDGEGDRRRTAR